VKFRSRSHKPCSNNNSDPSDPDTQSRKIHEAEVGPIVFNFSMVMEAGPSLPGTKPVEHGRRVGNDGPVLSTVARSGLGVGNESGRSIWDPIIVVDLRENLIYPPSHLLGPTWGPRQW
jgi:hypothetical protein